MFMRSWTIKPANLQMSSWDFTRLDWGDPITQQQEGKTGGELQIRDGGKGEEAPLSGSGFWHPSVFTACSWGSAHVPMRFRTATGLHYPANVLSTLITYIFFLIQLPIARPPIIRCSIPLVFMKQIKKIIVIIYKLTCIGIFKPVCPCGFPQIQ